MSKYNSMIEKRDEMEAEYDAYMESDGVTVEEAKERMEAIKSFNAEIEQFEALEKSRSELKAAQKARSEFRTERPFGFSNEKKADNSVKSIAERLVGGDQYKAAVKSWSNREMASIALSFDVSPAALKAASDPFVRGSLAGAYPDLERGVNTLGRVEYGFTDLFSQSGTTRDAVTYLRQTVLNRGAAAVAEGAKKPYSTNRFDPETVKVEKVAVLTKMTEEQATDFEETEGFLRDIVAYDVPAKWDELAYAGTGTTPQIKGLTQFTVPTMAKVNADSLVDTLVKGIAQVESLRGNKVKTIAMSPADLLMLRILKNATTGNYVLGNPLTDSLIIPGVEVLSFQVIPAGTVWMGDFKRAGTWYTRSSLRIDIANTNVDDFENNLLTMRAESRNALAIKKPDALLKITGFANPTA